MNRRYPRYPDDADYQTNAPSYYEDLARKQKLIQLLAEKIWEYDERLNERLEDLKNVLQDYLSQWDKRIENLDKEVSHIFVSWLEDGTLEQIINHDVLGNKADKLFVDSEIERLDQKDENLTTQLAQTIPLNNVSQYGFNSDSIIQAISEAENGSVIGFPFGEYIIDKEVTLNKEINLIGFNATLKFEGEGKLIINNNNVNISGFVFDGQNNDLSCLLRINKDLNNITINDNVFKNVSSVTHNNSYFIEVHCVNISNLSIRGNVFKGITNLSTVVGVGDFAGFIFFRSVTEDVFFTNKNIEVKDNTMENCRTVFPKGYSLEQKIMSKDADAIRLYATQSNRNENFTIENNKILDAQKRFIKITGYNDILIDGIEGYADIYNEYESDEVPMSTIGQLQSANNITFKNIKATGYIGSGFETPNSDYITIENIVIDSIKPSDTAFITTYQSNCKVENVTTYNIRRYGQILGRGLVIKNIKMYNAGSFLEVRAIGDSVIENIFIEINPKLYDQLFNVYTRPIIIGETPLNSNVMFRNIEIKPISLLTSGQIVGLFIRTGGDFKNIVFDGLIFHDYLDALYVININSGSSNIIIKNSIVHRLYIPNSTNIDISNTIVKTTNTVTGENIYDGSRIMFNV